MNDREASQCESLLYACDGETAAQAVTETLTRRGFRVVRSFDLRSALAAHVGCECPQHGTAKCTCQFVVLLVYGASDTLVVTVHSREARAQVQIVRPAGMLCDDAGTQPDVRVVEQVRAVLFEAALTMQAQASRPVGVPTNVCQES